MAGARVRDRCIIIIIVDPHVDRATANSIHHCFPPLATCRCAFAVHDKTECYLKNALTLTKKAKGGATLIVRTDSAWRCTACPSSASPASSVACVPVSPLRPLPHRVPLCSGRRLAPPSRCPPLLPATPRFVAPNGAKPSNPTRPRAQPRAFTITNRRLPTPTPLWHPCVAAPMVQSRPRPRTPTRRRRRDPRLRLRLPCPRCPRRSTR